MRSRRYRAHRDGDHSLCKQGCDRRGLHIATPGDVTPLVQAVRDEFSGADPLIVAMAERLAEMAEGHGAGAVQAVRALAELVSAQR